MVAITPKGSEGFRQSDPASWRRLWGKVNPNLIEVDFWRRALRGWRLFLATTPLDLDTVRAFHDGDNLEADPAELHGRELVCLAQTRSMQ